MPRSAVHLVWVVACVLLWSLACGRVDNPLLDDWGAADETDGGLDDGVGGPVEFDVDLALAIESVKQFVFTWNAIEGAAYYRLIRTAADGEIWASEPILDTSLRLTVALYDEVDATYELEVCAEGCVSSEDVLVVADELVRGIGVLEMGRAGAHARFGSSVALSGDGRFLAVGAIDEDSAAIGIDGDQTDDAAPNAGAVYMFAHDGRAWTQQAYVKASNSGEGDYFGSSVALSHDGSVLAVGAPLEDSAATGIDGEQSDDAAPNAGAVYVFARSEQAWSQQSYLKPSNAAAGDSFGASVAVSGDGSTIAVGAHFQDGDGIQDAGAVFVFVGNEQTWAQQAHVKAQNPGVGDRFGWSVALSHDGNTLAVGAPFEDGAGESAQNAGVVYTYARAGQSWVQRGHVRADNSGLGDKFGWIVALSSDAETLAVGAPGEDGGSDGGAVQNAGAVYVFVYTDQAWTQQAYVKAHNPGAGDEFGASVALSPDGNTLAVGAPFEASAASGIEGDQDDDSAPDAGAAYVFWRDGQMWVRQAYVKASNSERGDEFGASVAISHDGDTLAIGAPLEDGATAGFDGNQHSDAAPDAGAVYMFARDEQAWAQRTYAKASNSAADAVDDEFGWTVALSHDGQTLAVGAPFEDQSDDARQHAGFVHVFVRDERAWVPQTCIAAANAGADDYFGASVALSDDGNTLAVGAPFEDGDSTQDAGAVHVFARDGQAWAQQARIEAANADVADYFGSSVAISADGSTLAVGAPFEDSVGEHDPHDDAAQSAGAVYVFARDGQAWTQSAYVKADNVGMGDNFGSSVALSSDGHTLAIGAHLANGEANGKAVGDAGAVYVFARIEQAWAQQERLMAPDPGESDNFGASVALSGDGDTLAVGAPFADGEHDDAGAVFVFTRGGQAWAQQHQLDASNPGAGDNFGASVALSHDGETLAVAAPLERSTAIGIEGDQADDAAQAAGAVYVFARGEQAWTQRAYVKPTSSGAGHELGSSVALSDDRNTLAVGAPGASTAYLY